METNSNIVNIKVSTKLLLPFSLDSLFIHLNKVNKCCHVKKVNNMIIVKSAVHVYVILASKPLFSNTTDVNKFHCNITGISNIVEIERARDYFLFLFFPGIDHSQESIKIDSITSKFDYGGGINLHSLYANIEDSSIINKKLNLHTFPSLKIRFEKVGCAQLYSSGRCILLGQKSENDLKIVKSKLDSMISNTVNRNVL